VTAYTIRVACPGDKGRGHETRPANVVRFFFIDESSANEGAGITPGWHDTTGLSRSQRPEKLAQRSTLDAWNYDYNTEAGREHVDSLEPGVTWREDMNRVFKCALCRDNVQVADFPKLCRILDALRAHNVQTLTLANLRTIYETYSV
jgi:hypothetical protein